VYWLCDAGYEELELQTTQLAALPEEISHLESTIANLRASQQPRSSNPSLNLPLQPTLSLLSKKEQELVDLDRQIANLRRVLPEKKRAVADLEADLGPLEARKNGAVQSANEAKRGRENGGLGDELEERGRWLKGVDRGLRAMLEVSWFLRAFLVTRCEFWTWRSGLGWLKDTQVTRC
jgi:predicted RNase H-like nuclease (RuvC/YqgF family)